MTEFEQLTSTPEGQEALKGICAAMMFEKLGTAKVLGATESGRVQVEHVAEPGPATAMFRELVAQARA